MDTNNILWGKALFFSIYTLIAKGVLVTTTVFNAFAIIAAFKHFFNFTKVSQ